MTLLLPDLAVNQALAVVKININIYIYIACIYNVTNTLLELHDSSKELQEKTTFLQYVTCSFSFREFNTHIIRKTRIA